jgi:glyoxalase family protein
MTPTTTPSVARGIHHVTAISGDAQRTLDFYAGVLGLRLVKRTVNFDDPGTYHFYFGDESGTPGSILTFFPWGGAPRGRVGAGQVAVTALAVPPAALAFWLERLVAHSVPHEGPTRRFAGADGAGETVVAFEDPDGLRLELVTDPRAAALAGWTAGHTGAVPAEHAVRGVYGVTLWVGDTAGTAAVLEGPLGMRQAAASGDVVRFETVDADARLGRVVDVRAVDATGGRARMGVGTVHHVAFRTGDDAGELAIREAVTRAGLSATPQIDRQYFHSVYFREPGGVLFELATDAPGFLTDEAPDALGAALRLPPQYEARRAELERVLPPLVLPGDAAAGDVPAADARAASTPAAGVAA